VPLREMFLRSLADVLNVSFRESTENCLCGKSRPGLYSVELISALPAPIIALPRTKSVGGAASSSYGRATYLSPPLPLSRGRSENGGEGLQRWDA